MIDAFKRYLMKEKNFSDNTVDGYCRDLSQFFSFTKKDFQSIVSNDITDFISFLRDRGNTVTTANRKLASLKLYFRFLVTKGFRDSNPAELIESGRIEKRLPKPMEEGEVTKLINSTGKNYRDKAIFEVMYGAGLRRSEVIKLRMEDINWERGVIRVFGKGRKDRLVPLNGRALSALKLAITGNYSEWVFPSKRCTCDGMKESENHISLRRINEIVEKYANKAGIKGVSPHTFRKSLATHLYAKGADIRSIQEILGHESIDTTSIYTKLYMDRTINEYQKLFPSSGSLLINFI